MNPQDCPSWEICAAPLCPIDCHEKAQWFPDEDICNSKTIAKPFWVKTQRKIKKLYSKAIVSDEYCFTLPMLQAMKVVRRPKGMRPEDLYKNSTCQTRHNVSISRALPLK